MQDDDLLTLLEDDDPAAPALLLPWNILIVDDEPDVHASTRLALAGERIHGRELTLFSCYKGYQAIEFLTGNPVPIHLMFLDAVMETPDAGINCARTIKALYKMSIPIIVMRSGFAPGRVEEELEQHGYLAEFLTKTDATKEKLLQVLNRWLKDMTDDAR